MILNKITTRDNLYIDYYQALNGVLKLTPLELSILASLSTIQTSNNDSNPLSKENRVNVSKALNITNFNLNNYIKNLKKKSLIIKVENRYIVNPNLILDDSKSDYSIEFNFKIK